MKNKIFKLFLSLLIVFAFVTTVNASVVNCGSDDTVVTITEENIVYAGFDAVMPYCTWEKKEGEYNIEDGNYESYQEAYNSGEDLETAYVETLDAKDFVATAVPRCSSSEREVHPVYICPKVLKSATCVGVGDDQARCERHLDKCKWNATLNKCEGKDNPNDTYTYYGCKNGYTETEDGNCIKTGENPVTGNVTPPDGCDVKYKLYCPKYDCIPKYDKFKLCTPTFEVDGQPAYCVNPTQKFNKESNNYQMDDSFNVFDCASSYSTVDCGYANILIEGAYYNQEPTYPVNDTAINTALRLWGVHSGQAGFDKKSGVARVTGEDCTVRTYFPKVDNEVVNVYQRTHDYIMYDAIGKAKFYDVAIQMTHIPEETSCTSRGVLTGNTFEAITCDAINDNNSSMAGVMCGPNGDYRIAFELYFNTLIGNSCMKEHLSMLYGGGDGSKPTAATLQSEFSFEEENSETNIETWVEISFEHESFWNEIQSDRVGCSDRELNELKQQLIDQGKTEEEAEAILNEIRPYCQIVVYIVDGEGNILVTEQQIAECIKDIGCHTENFEFAVCDISENSGRDIEIRVKYQRTRSSYSVRKYYSCASADLNQTLFAFFDDNSENGNGSSEGEEVDREIIETSFSVLNYKCSGGCDNANPRISGDKECSDDLKNYNGYYSSKVKDPSLRCILNLNEPSSKTKYDYSSYYGVNTNFCRIYCSDEVEYVLADKVKAISGRTFMYDIEFPYYGKKELNYNLTSVVNEKRACVSDIYYNHLEDIEQIRKDYGLTEDEFKELKNKKTFAGLFTILKNKSGNEGNRDEVLNQIIYDVYNCNLYNKEAITDSGVKVPKNYSSDFVDEDEGITSNYGLTVNDKVQKVYAPKNRYGLGTDPFGNTNSNNGNDTVVYKFGALIKNGNGARVDNVEDTAVYDGKIGKIKRCKNDNGVLCYGYDPEQDEQSYNYPSTNSNGFKTYTLNSGKNINVPTNDYARFEVSSNIHYYNNNMYQSDYGSGEVVLGNSNPDLLTLPSFSYPIDKNAYNLDACNRSIEKGLWHRCNVVQKLNPLTYYRNRTANSLYVNDGNQFKCYVDVEKPNCPDPSKDSCDGENSAVTYRNVDPTNLFPSGNIKDKLNWNTQIGKEVRESIETTANELTIGDKYLDYSITLTPTQIKNIREYNKQNGSYADERIDNCQSDDIAGIYTNCQSTFLNILRGSSSEFAEGVYGSINVDKQ